MAFVELVDRPEVTTVQPAGAEQARV